MTSTGSSSGQQASGDDEVAAPVTIAGPDELLQSVGRTFGPTAWLTMTQERVNLFAEATGDHQWIHVDEEKAASGPFGGTIAHGYLTLSLASWFLPQLIDVQNLSMGINYGVDKVRFPSPVPVGADLRMGVTVAGVEDTDGGVQVTYDLVMEVKDAPKPACVAQVVYRYYR